MPSILDGPGGGDLPMLIVPEIVRTCAFGARSLRVQSKQFRDAIDPEIVAFMTSLNEGFAQYQMFHRALVKCGVPRASRVASDPVDMTQAQIEERYQQDVLRVRAQEKGLHSFRERVAAVFTEDVAQGLCKAVTMVAQDDPHATSSTIYTIGFDTVHAYLAMAARRCEVCSHHGKRCLNHHSFKLVPSGHRSSRILFCRDKCVDDNCVIINTMSCEPLSISSRSPMGIVKNAELFKCILRHVGITPPFSSAAISKRMGADRYDALTEKTPVFAPPGEDTVPARDRRIYERQNTRYWLLAHPTLPPHFSLCEKLCVSAQKIEMATADVRRARDIQNQIDEYTRAMRLEKLMGDVNALLERAGLARNGFSNVAEVDSLYPGVAKTVEKMLQAGRERELSDQHALDSTFIPMVVKTIIMLVGDLRRHDQSLTGDNCASGRAYTYVTGLCSGEHPNLSLSSMVDKFNSDPLALKFQLDDWRSLVTAMHAFDALQWNRLKIHPCLPRADGQAGGSSDPFPSADPSSRVGWTINIGGADAHAVTLTAQMTPPDSQAEYKAIASACEARLDELGLEAALPAVPSQAHIDAFVKDFEHSDAVNFLEVAAQTMAYHDETRAIALDILTGANTRAFINAVACSGLDVEALSAEAVAVKMDTATCP